MLSLMGMGLALTTANSTAHAAIPIQMGLSPDNSRELLFSAIASARSEILINIYQFDRKDLTDLLISKIQSGLTLRILIEGEPVGKISSGGKKVIASLLDAMDKQLSQKNRIYLMTKGQNNAKRRFAFNHAKYVIVDRMHTYIASENFTGSGTPDAGTIGNRGWQTVISDRDFATKMTELFNEDASLRYGDVQDLTGDEADFDSDYDHDRLQPLGASRPVAAIPSGSGQASSVELITSPRSVDPLVEVMSRAHQSLRLEHMSLPKDWRYPSTQMSPWVSSATTMAKRGVNVQILLNDEAAFESAVIRRI